MKYSVAKKFLLVDLQTFHLVIFRKVEKIYYLISKINFYFIRWL